MSATVIALAWRSFICRACGLIYDEAQGDIDSGLAPGTRFEDIPDDWCCPLCGVSKADFEPYEAPASRSRCSAAPAVRGATRRSDPGVVIVGAGRAGWQVAQALRARDAAMPITMVSACSADGYDKPMLSVVHARGLALDGLVRESATAAAERLGVRLLPMTHAVHIDAGSQQLRTTRGTLRYRRLVLASGAAPRLPAALPPSLVWRVNDLAAYRRLRTALDAPRLPGSAPGRQVLIVGGGLVGCELANDLALGGHAVTLLDLQPRPLAAVLPPQASERLLQAWQELPLRFVGGVQVARVERSDAGLTRVATVCGLSFEADAVIAATGLTTPDRLARSAGLAFDTRAGGIEVNPASLRSSNAAIHALGDCIAIGGRASRYIEPIDRQAQAIASAICGNAAGAPYVHRPVPLRVKTSSLPITLDGEPHPEGRWEVETDTPGELRMAQRRAGAVTARLVARRAVARSAAP